MEGQEAEKQKASAEKEIGSLGDIENLRAENSENRENLSLQRSRLVDARAAYDEIVRVSIDRAKRLEAIRIIFYARKVLIYVNIVLELLFFFIGVNKCILQKHIYVFWANLKVKIIQK